MDSLSGNSKLGQVIYPNLGERVFHLDLLLNSAFFSDSILAFR